MKELNKHIFALQKRRKMLHSKELTRLIKNYKTEFQLFYKTQIK